MAAPRELNIGPKTVHIPSRAFLPCVVAGMLALAPRNADAAERGAPVLQPAQRPVAAYSGCPDAEREETFSNRHGIVRESVCSMEISYADGRAVRFDASSRSRRGTVRDLLPGREFTIILTENYAIVAPGMESTSETSFDIELPEKLRRRPAAFDADSNNLYILSSGNELHVTNVLEGGWRRGPSSENIKEDAQLIFFRGLPLVLQSGSVPVIAWGNAVPGEEEWVEKTMHIPFQLCGPISVEAQEERIILRGQNASLEITVKVDGDAGSVAVSPIDQE